MIGYNAFGAPFSDIELGQNSQLQQHLSLPAVQITFRFARISILYILGPRPRV
jgi:hypothetical protein